MAYELEAERIESFVAHLGWRVAPGVIAAQLKTPERSSHPLLGPLRAFATGYGRFTLTDRSNVYGFEPPPLEPRDAPIDVAQADAIAHDFACRIVPDLDTRFERLAVKHVPPSFNYAWMQHPAGNETSVYPNTIDLRVDSWLGAVTRFTQSDLPFARVTPPGIDAAQARARILELSGDEGIVDELTISEDPRDHATRAETIWYGIVMREGGPTGIERVEVVIHADTGERYYFEGEQPR